MQGIDLLGLFCVAVDIQVVEEEGGSQESDCAELEVLDCFALLQGINLLGLFCVAVDIQVVEEEGGYEVPQESDCAEPKVLNRLPAVSALWRTGGADLERSLFFHIFRGIFSWNER